MTNNKTVRAQVRSLITGEYVWMNVIQKEPMTAPDVNADVRARLLPCPFCGGDKATVSRVANVGHAISCNGCGASSEIGPPADLAAAKWNRRAAHADLAGEVREWQPEETAPDGDLVDVWVGGTENGFRYANAVKLGGIWCDRNGYRLTLKGIRLWIKPPADPALAKFHPTQRATNYVSGYVDDAGKFHPTHQEKP